MSFLKYASFEVLSAELAPSRVRRTAGVVKTFKHAHRAKFEYTPKPGFLYVRSRAISSRCNDNFDEFPAPEIKLGYRTFIGKPVFVNHNNENHRRMRGVIIDAALHEDRNPDGSPDTWAEVLMEVDAVRFPKLAQAILAGHIDRTSMGTDVAHSICSFCGNKATTPLEYCQHIPKLKGKRIRRTTASGTKEDVLVREICYGLKFFENSLLVEEPADPTAYFLGVDASGIGVTASKQAYTLDTNEMKRNMEERARKKKHHISEWNGWGHGGFVGSCDHCGMTCGIHSNGGITPGAMDEPCSGAPSSSSSSTTGSLQKAAALIAEASDVPGPDNITDLGGVGARTYTLVGPIGQGTRHDFELHIAGCGDLRQPKYRNISDGWYNIHADTWQQAAEVWFDEDMVDLGYTADNSMKAFPCAKSGVAKEAPAAKRLDPSICPGTGQPFKGSPGGRLYWPCPVCGTSVGTGRGVAPRHKKRPEFWYGERSVGVWPDDKVEKHICREAGQQALCGAGEVKYIKPMKDTPVRGMCPQCVSLWENALSKESTLTSAATLIAEAIRIDAAVEKRKVPVLGIDEYMTINTRPEDTARIDALLPFLLYGPDYRRGVFGELKDYSLFMGRGETEAAERALYGAELQAGVEEWNYERYHGRPETLPGMGYGDKLGKLAINELVAPAKVDTLRDEICPVCGEPDSYDGDKCMVCGFVKPPDQFMDPDLEKAKNTDLRQEQGEDVALGGTGDLICDNCGQDYAAAEMAETDDLSTPQNTQQWVDTPPQDEPQDPAKKKTDPDNAAKPDPDPTKDPAKLPQLPKPKKPEDDADAKPEDKKTDTAPKHGDPCPNCGKGTLKSKTQAGGEGDAFVPPVDGDKGAPQDGAEDKNAKGDTDDEEGKGGDDGDDDDNDKKPPWMKKKKSTLSQDARVHENSDDPQKEQSMRPALAALAAQQKVIESQEKRLDALHGGFAFIADMAGLSDHPQVQQVLQTSASLRTTADVNNPAQPLPDPGSEAPSETTDQALAPAGRDDPQSIGASPVTDVAPDATADPTADFQTVADEPLTLNEQDVTAPVAGTEGPRPLNEVKIETEQRIGPWQGNDPSPAFPLQGPFAEQQKTTGAISEGRTFASLRLARLRLQAGIAEGDDLELGTSIASSPQSDEAIQSEIDTLSKVVTGARRQQATAPRHLVPRQAAAAGVARTVPSMASAEPAIPIQTVAVGVADEEFLFE